MSHDAPAGRLAHVDLGLKLSEEEELARLTAAQERLLALRLAYAGLLGEARLGPPILVIFEGWDAGGKGGAIRRIVTRLDPRHYRVVQFRAPTPDELRRHWLLRFTEPLPADGEMTILDRSWYGRVLVERVEGYATPAAWQRAYRQIVGFEQMLAAEHMVIVKFWLHLSPDEQLRRFRKREQDPLSRWKLTDEDWRNRARWDDYLEAAEEMFERTDHPAAPWFIISAESKRWARVSVLETLNANLERGLRAAGIEPPRDGLRGE